MTPSKTRSAVNRRARQNKAPKSQMKKSDVSREWSLISMPRPVAGLRLNDNLVYSFVQIQTLPSVVTSSTSVPTFISIGSSLNALPQAASFQALFDQYRIKEVELWFEPATSTVTGSTSTTSTGQTYSVIDYDDGNNLTSVSAALQYQNCLVSDVSHGHYRRFRPHVAIAAYSGSTFTAYANQSSQWIDVVSSGTPHYGFKAVIDVTSAAVMFNATSRIHIEFRNLI